MSADKRRSPRLKVNSQAWIDFGDGSPVRRCTLVDISRNGARLEVEDIEDVPQEFQLFLARTGRPGYQCSVIWKLNKHMGLMFVADEFELQGNEFEFQGSA